MTNGTLNIHISVGHVQQLTFYRATRFKIDQLLSFCGCLAAPHNTQSSSVHLHIIPLTLLANMQKLASYYTLDSVTVCALAN